MRVLHLVSVGTMTGPADPAVALAQTQLALGYQVALAWDRVREGDMTRRVAAAGLEAEPSLSLCTKGGVFLALRDRRRLASLMQQYDIVHCHTSHDHALGSLARRAGQGARLVRTIHHPRSVEKRAFQRMAYRRTDGLILVAEAHRARLLTSYPKLEAARLAVVPGAVDPRRFTPEVSGEGLRAEHGIPLTAKVIGMVARFQAGRRQPELIRAFKELRLRTPADVWLVLIGKGETQGELEAEIRALGVGDRTRLYGFRDRDLPQAIRSCDVTVLLQQGSDASCRAVLQSLAVGVPVIGARYAAITEALEGRGCGWLVEPGDSEGLVEALLEWAQSSPEASRERSALARGRVLERYSEDARAKKVDDLYRRLLALPFVR